MDPDLDALGKTDFIRAIVSADLQSGKHDQVVTRFPPEPNGYLHIGHAKALAVNFGIASQYAGICRLRFDDTNPAREDVEYVEAIQEDIRWMGWAWEGAPRYASEYFEQLHAWAFVLIDKGLAYVDLSDDETIRSHRGTVTEAGRPTPDRERSIAENRDLFERMTAGEFPDGHCVLRAKIDLANPNMKMRDPLMYRVRHIAHHHVGNRWCVYPFYDWAHGLSDYIEGVTHSLCTLEFENNRELYDWYLQAAVPGPHPRQIESARLAITYFMMSKRRLLALVEEGVVDGWDDPRMPTLSAMRRRGVPAQALHDFVARVGLAKTNSVVPYEWFEEAIREVLNTTAPRRMAVLDPLKVVVTTFGDETDWLELPSFPPELNRSESRRVPFTREVFIERTDFSEEPPRGWKRAAPGVEVRLRGAWLVTITDVVRGEDGAVLELRATHDPGSRGGTAPDGRKVKGTLHWVSATEGLRQPVRLYDRLFAAEAPGSERDFREDVNPTSLQVVEAALEPALAGAAAGDAFQFERTGYFAVDSKVGGLNRVVTLRDSWGKAKGPAKRAPKVKAQGVAAAVRELTADEAAICKALIESGLSEATADGLARAPELLPAFEAGTTDRREELARMLLNDVRAHLKGDVTVEQLDGVALGGLVDAIADGVVSSKAAAKLLPKVLTGGDARALAESMGLTALGDAALEAAVDGVLAASAAEVERFRGGEKKLMGFFVGQVMKATRGRADAKATAKLLGRKLS